MTDCETRDTETVAELDTLAPKDTEGDTLGEREVVEAGDREGELESDSEAAIERDRD